MKLNYVTACGMVSLCVCVCAVNCVPVFNCVTQAETGSTFVTFGIFPGYMTFIIPSTIPVVSSTKWQVVYTVT